MKGRKYEKLPMDQELRAQTLRVIEAYKTSATNLKGTVRESSPQELVPAMMKVISDSITAYDNKELSPTLQRKLISMMKKLVRKYPV